MKKKLSYRDKLIELAYIYEVKEIIDYVKSRKNLTSGQLELILKKNKITIPKDFKSNFLRDNIFKPAGKIKFNLIEFDAVSSVAFQLFTFLMETKKKIMINFREKW